MSLDFRKCLFCMLAVLNLFGCGSQSRSKSWEVVYQELLNEQIHLVNQGQQNFVVFLETQNTDDLVDRLLSSVLEPDRIRSVEFVVSDLTIGGLRKLGRLPSLERLAIDGGGGVSESGLAELIKFLNLKYLKISNIRTTSDFFDTIRRIASLEEVCLKLNENSVIDRPFVSIPYSENTSTIRNFVLVQAPFDASQKEYIRQEFGTVVHFLDETPAPWPRSWK